MTTIIMMTRLSKGPLSEKLQALLQKLRHMQFPMLMRTEPPSDKLQALLRKLRNTTASLSWTWLCERLSMAWPNIISPNSTCAWLEWLELASTDSAKVLAALLLHAAWCMEWSDGLPWSKSLQKLVALTRDGAQVRQHMQAGFPFHVMRFLQLSAEDCKHVGLLHSRLLICLASSERKGLPFAS